MAVNPNDTAKEREYIFEIYGEVTVCDYSEEQAEEQFHENMSELIRDAIRDGKIEIS